MFTRRNTYRMLMLGLISLMLPFLPAAAQHKAYNDPGAGNPLLPGYFADPTVKKFGDTFYIYATTDGNGGGFGPAQVWMSKDFVNWSLQDMNWPTTHYYWAPDVTQAPDGKYYMYYCQPVEIFGAWASTPVGPWTPLLPPGKPVVKNFEVPNVITLDGQTFRDDDGKMYMFWGTWGIYPNHGCGVGLLNPDMKSFAKMAQIPNTVATDFFEAPFMFKRKGIYYLTYSSGRCEDDTYRVQYAMSKTGPMGPFVFGKNNPVLSTNADGTVHGPGHQSVLQQGDDFYLIYHRHNNPHSGGGYHRQVAADKLVFDREGNIEKLVPTHEGIGFLAKDANPSPDLLLNRPVTASSSYSQEFKPSYAVDHNNGTLWKPGNNTLESWLSVDMGTIKQVKSVQTQFEYATWYYQYLIEYSIDGKSWMVFADKTKNTIHGSPMIDLNDVRARYLRLTITNTEYPGLNKAVWNIRAFADDAYHPIMTVKPKDPGLIPHIKAQGLLVDLDAGGLEAGDALSSWANHGKLGGAFLPLTAGLPAVSIIAGKKAVVFDGHSAFTANFNTPESLSGNSSFTVAMWVNNPEIGDEEPLISWTLRGGVDMTNAAIGYGSNKRWGAAAHWGWADMPYKNLPPAGKWHHIAVVFDGTTEKLYVDGVLDRSELKMLFLANLKNFILGTTADQNAWFSGALASLKVYDIPLSATAIAAMAAEQNNADAGVYLNTASLDYGKVQLWNNEGFSGYNFVPEQVAPQVADVEGKIAVVFKGGDRLRFEAAKPAWMQNGDHTIMIQVADKKLGKGWHYVMKVMDAAGEHLYLDGQSAHAIPAYLKEEDQKITLGSPDEKKQGQTAVSFLGIVNHGISAAGADSLYRRWRMTLPAVAAKVGFEEQPSAVSSAIITMKAAKAVLPGSIYQYYFSETSGTTGGKSSGWLNSASYVNFGLQPGKQYVYSLRARDNYGNVTAGTTLVKVSTSPALFRTFSDPLNQPEDFLHRTSGTSWDGLLGKPDTATVVNGSLVLGSTDTKWDGAMPQGPFLYKNVAGDFVAEVKVTDVSGLKKKKANGANDAGLMVLATDDTGNLIQNSIFPGWAVGNMVTNLDKDGRMQNNNASGWNFYPWLQIQRTADTFFLRGSTDGIHWKDLPGSPLIRKDLDHTLRVGLFQATYGANYGYGSFAGFQIIQRK